VIKKARTRFKVFLEVKERLLDNKDFQKQEEGITQKRMNKQSEQK
jgi:hypothetical protein